MNTKTLLCAALLAFRGNLMKRTYQPSKIKRARTHGFRARQSTLGEERFLTTEEERVGPPCLSKGNGVKVLHTL